MIDYEEFSITYNPYHYHATPGLKRLLKQQSIDILTELTLSRTEDNKTVTKVFSKEDAISVTVLSRKYANDYGRGTVENLTFVFKLMDYLDHYKVFDQFPPSDLVELITA